MIVPLAELKQAAQRVLLRELRPIHYLALTDACTTDLGRSVSDAERRSLSEDLREKALLSGALGMGYLGRPFAVGFLRDWFSPPTLLNVDEVRVPLTEAVAVRAGQEAALRYPHILNKFGRSAEQHAAAVSRGLLLEFGVRAWFASSWPSLYRPPTNDGQYRQPCDHDFRLVTHSFGTLTVDVAGPDRDGDFGGVPGKPRCDLHVVAVLDELSIVIRGVVAGGTFKRAPFAAEQSQPISRFRVILNCEVGCWSWPSLSNAMRSQALLRGAP